MLSPLPRRSVWAYHFAHFTQPYQPSPKGSSGRPAHCPFRGLLGVHSRCGLHTRAVTVYRDTLSEGFSQFVRSEEHTSELQSRLHLVCRLLLEKKKTDNHV